MKRDIYISSVNILNRCLYACTIKEGKKVIDTKVGLFYVESRNKAAMYASDLMTLNNRQDNADLVFHFDTPYALDYVNQMRKIKTCIRTPFDNEEFNLNQKKIYEYVCKEYPAMKQLYEKGIKDDR